MNRGKIQMRPLVERVLEEFEYIAELYAAHLPAVYDPSSLHITVHTNEAVLRGEYLDLTSAEEVVIDIGEAEPLRLPFDILATSDGPGHPQGNQGVTIYMAENVLGAESRDVETGLSYFRRKLAGRCPACNADAETLRRHYSDNRDCQEVVEV